MLRRPQGRERPTARRPRSIGGHGRDSRLGGVPLARSALQRRQSPSRSCSAVIVGAALSDTPFVADAAASGAVSAVGAGSTTTTGGAGAAAAGDGASEGGGATDGGGTSATAALAVVVGAPHGLAQRWVPGADDCGRVRRAEALAAACDRLARLTTARTMAVRQRAYGHRRGDVFLDQRRNAKGERSTPARPRLRRYWLDLVQVGADESLRLATEAKSASTAR